jgi:hypothetical protein
MTVRYAHFFGLGCPNHQSTPIIASGTANITIAAEVLIPSKGTRIAAGTKMAAPTFGHRRERAPKARNVIDQIQY